MISEFKTPLNSLSKRLHLPTAMMLTCIVAILFSGCDINLGGMSGIKGSGVQAVQSFDVEPFDQVRFSGSGTYNIKCGGEQSVSVKFDDNLIEFVECKVENGKLKLNITESYNSSMGLTVDITVPELSRVDVSGAGSANISNYSGEKLAIDVSGAASVTAAGTADSLDVQASGACSLKLLELVSKTCSVDMSGAGSAKVHATEKLDAKISGVGSVEYKGDPEVNKQVSGIGSVSKLD